MSIGAELSVAVGPVGRTGAGNVSVAAEGIAHAYSCEWWENMGSSLMSWERLQPGRCAASLLKRSTGRVV